VSIKYSVEEDNRHLVVKSNGTVKQSIIGVFSTQCKQEVHEFPFDVQLCPINIGPWFHRVNEVNIRDVSIGSKKAMFA
ncbi:hypothetical protein PFISCL1PPCAC_27010, partial [Pristionchus fissidentatus]